MKICQEQCLLGKLSRETGEARRAGDTELTLTMDEGERKGSLGGSLR